MLKLKVAAFSISNLTDARYFSAYGVDWLAYTLEDNRGSLADLDKIQEIIQWVEGPKSIGMFNTVPSSELLDLIKAKINLDALALPKYETVDIKIPIFSVHPLESTSHLILTNLENLEKVDKDSITSVFVKVSALSEVKTILEMEKPPGIILEGGEEAEVGLKSYELYDDIFDLIYD